MAASTANTQVKKKSLIAALRELDIAAKDVVTYSKDILTAKQLQLKISSLKVQLANKDEEISCEKSKSKSLESSQAQLSKYFKRRSAAWINERNHLNA
jgi:uncharacterized protein (DUF3084 family)